MENTEKGEKCRLITMESESLEKALERVNKLFGDAAIVVSSKKKRAQFGLMKKESYELKVLVDERHLLKKVGDDTAESNSYNPISGIEAKLNNQEIDISIVKEITQDLWQWSLDKKRSKEELLNYCKQIIESFLWKDNDELLHEKQLNDPVMMTFVGPTGVGKTTTVAKIAYALKFKYSRDLCLVSLDSFKVSGAEHLKSYAKLFDCSFREAHDIGELKEISLDCKKKNKSLLLDTPGLGPKEEDLINLLKEYLFEVESEIHLCLSATHAKSMLKKNFNRYKVLSPEKIIITKTDEADCVGALFSLLCETGMPASYFTKGQKVPHDIERAKKESIAALLLMQSTAVLV